MTKSSVLNQTSNRARIQNEYMHIVLNMLYFLKYGASLRTYQKRTLKHMLCNVTLKS